MFIQPINYNNKVKFEGLNLNGAIKKNTILADTISNHHEIQKLTKKLEQEGKDLFVNLKKMNNEWQELSILDSTGYEYLSFGTFPEERSIKDVFTGIFKSMTADFMISSRNLINISKTLK